MTRPGALLRRIIWKKRSAWELAFAAFGFVLGLGLFLISMQVSVDIDEILNVQLAEGKEPDFIVISKKTASGFTEEEIAGLGNEPFVLDSGSVLSNGFEAEASFQFFGQGFRSMIFFEAIPDRFLDVIPAGWSDAKIDDTVPVIISRDFLLLYNFGFARSRNFPYVSEDLLGLVPVTILVRGNGKEKRFAAHIAGLSDRFASILIPYHVMTALNAEFEEKNASTPMRTIIAVTDRSDPTIAEFIDSHSYETGRDKLRLSDLGAAVKTIAGVVALIGLALVCLSLIVFLMSFRLIIFRSSVEVKLLTDLGHTTTSIVRSFMGVLCPVFLGIALVTAGFVIAGIALFREFLRMNGFAQFTYFIPAHIAIAGTVLILSALALNYFSLRVSVHPQTSRSAVKKSSTPHDSNADTEQGA